MCVTTHMEGLGEYGKQHHGKMINLAESRLFVKWDKFNREKHKESGEWQRMIKKTKLTQAQSTPPRCLQKGIKRKIERMTY